MSETFENNLNEHIALFPILEALSPAVNEAAKVVLGCLRTGRTVFLCGNGGSAADYQHVAAVFTGRFVRERAPRAAIALTTDTSALTAIGNDYEFGEVSRDSLPASHIQAIALGGYFDGCEPESGKMSKCVHYYGVRSRALRLLGDESCGMGATRARAKAQKCFDIS